jgi:putative membrane protein
MNSKIKKILSLMLVSAMILSFPSTVSAEQKINLKEETVYVLLNEDGTTKTVYVVNSYENHADGQLVDYGEYETVRNLSTSDIIKNENPLVTADIPKGKFYYEGKMKNSQIPWDVNIIYKLDGNPIIAKELAGKDGELEIDINISQNKNFGSEFYKTYALQIATSLDTNKCHNITAEGAIIASIGENKNISFTLLPEKAGTYKISTDVSNFEMGAISISGVPFGMDLKLDGIDTMSEGVSELTDGIAKLDNGAQELQKGAKELQEGMNELLIKSPAIVSGSSEVLDAIRQINNAVSKVEGLTAPTGGITQLKTASAQYHVKVKELATKSQLLPKSSEAIYSGIKSSFNGLSAIATEDKSMETLLSNLSSMNDPNVNALVSAYKTKMEAANSIAIGLSTLESQYSTFHKGIGELAEGTQALSNGYTQIHSGIENINVIVNSLANITVAVNTLTNQYKQINNGIVQYTVGYKKIVSGYSAVYSGISNITSSTFELRDKTKNLDKEISEKIDNVVNEFSNNDFQPISFASKKNINISSVQFLMKTGDIKIQTPVEVINEDPKKLSFWEKFLALF